MPARVAHFTKLFDASFELVKTHVQTEIQSNALAFAKKWLDSLANMGLPEDAAFVKTQKLLADHAKVSATRFVAVALSDLLGEEGVQKAFENLQGDQTSDDGLQNAAVAIDSLAASCAVSGNALTISGQTCSESYFSKLGWLTLSRNGKTTKFLLKP